MPNTMTQTTTWEPTETGFRCHVKTVTSDSTSHTYGTVDRLPDGSWVASADGLTVTGLTSLAGARNWAANRAQAWGRR